MAILSNINGKFAVDSTGAIQLSGSAGTANYVLVSGGAAAAPTWVAGSTVIGGPYLPLSGGTLTGNLSLTDGSNPSLTVTTGATVLGGTLNVTGLLTGTTATFTGIITANSSSSGDYVRMYGSSGTGKWDIYGNGANLRISDNESAGILAVDTGASFGGTLTVDGSSSVFGGSGSIPIYVRSTSTVSYAQFQTSSTGSSGSNDGLTVGVNGSTAYIWQRENAAINLGTNNTTALTLDSSQNATFAGNITATTAGTTTVNSVSTGDWAGMQIQSSDAASAYLFFRDTSGERARIQSTASNDLKFSTNGGGSLALTLDSSINATFAGDVTLGTSKTLNFSGTSLQLLHDGSNGLIINNTGDLKIQNAATDKDIIFRGKDGASTIDALTLDMSEGGAANFAGTVSGGNGTFTQVIAPNGFLGGATGANGGIRIHSGGTKFFNITSANAARDGIMDIGASDARFKDLWLSGAVTGGTISCGAITTSGIFTSTLAINQASLPNAANEHVISLNPPTTTAYYGGGISWCEGAAAAASLGVYDAGSGGALGFYIATGNNTTLTQALTIDSSQKVGIGTTGPFSKLQVGTATFTGANGMHNDTRVGMSNHGILTGLMLASTYNDAAHPEYGLVFVQGPTTSSYNVWSISPDGPAKGSSLIFNYQAQSTNIHSPSNAKVCFQGSTGNVGIGTTAPSDYYADQLVVKSSSSENGITIVSDSTTDANYLMFARGTSGSDRYRGQIAYNHQIDAMLFATDATERMRITSAGYTKIKDDGDTTWDGYSFHAITQSAASQPTVMIYNDNAGGDNYGINVVHRSTSANTTGRFFLGATNNGGTENIKIYTNGNIQNTNNSYTQLSDLSLKENVVDATDKLEEVKKLRVINWNFIGDDLKQIGVAAQEVEKIFPGLVDEVEHNQDGETSMVKSVKYSVFVPILIKAIQELEARVKELENK